MQRLRENGLTRSTPTRAENVAFSAVVPSPYSRLSTYPKTDLENSAGYDL